MIAADFLAAFASRARCLLAVVAACLMVSVLSSCGPAKGFYYGTNVDHMLRMNVGVPALIQQDPAIQEYFGRPVTLAQIPSTNPGGNSILFQVEGSQRSGKAEFVRNNPWWGLHTLVITPSSPHATWSITRTYSDADVRQALRGGRITPLRAAQ